MNAITITHYLPPHPEPLNIAGVGE